MLRRSQVSSSLELTFVRAALGVVLFVASTGCSGDSSSRSPSTETHLGTARRWEAGGNAPRLFVSTPERFGLSAPGAVKGRFAFRLPDGWSEKPPSEMRALSFQAGAKGELDCSVTILGGDGGGDLANVNRWCGQVDVAAWDDARLNGAPKLAMLGMDATIVLLEESNKPRAILGALARHDSKSVFVKMIGPRDEVIAQRAAFEALCASLEQP